MRTILLFLICLVFHSYAFSQSKIEKDKKWTETESKEMDKAELLFAEKNTRLALPF